jgi:DNA-binding PadR family transcriptional regulator
VDGQEATGNGSPRPLNATAASLLGFLHAGPLTGWDLITTAELVIGDFWSLTRSQVYRELATMERAGLVAAGERGPRDRRPYHLTEAGREAFGAWLDREPGPEQIRYPLLLTMAFGEHLAPGRLADFVAAHRKVHMARLEGYEALRDDAGDGLGAHAAATLDFGIRYERAVLDWFDHLPDEVGGGGGGDRR